MARITSLLIGAGLVAIQACSSEVGSEDVGVSQAALCSDTPRPSETCANAKAWGFCGTDWFAGYCQNTCNACSGGSSTGGTSGTGGGSSSTSATIAANSDGTNCNTVTVSNGFSTASSAWRVVLDLKGATVTSSSSVTLSGTTGTPTATPNGNAAISAGASTTFKFCVSGSTRPTIKAYNVESNVWQACYTSNGKNPTKAALAVAMADELGRWAPDLDLVDSQPTNGNNPVQLSSSAACLKRNCANTKALVGQQYFSADKSVFNSDDYRSELKASFARQQTTLSDMRRNTPSKLPISDYKLTMVGNAPVSIAGACGPHYVFQVDYKSTGQPLSATDATNLMATMCFFGGFGCGGGNAYLGYVTTNIPNCPSGKQCIAIDPTDGDNGTGSSTSAGSAPSYPMNRVSDPDGTLLGTACITTKGVLATLQSKCSVTPSTCGTDYCM